MMDDFDRSVRSCDKPGHIRRKWSHIFEQISAVTPLHILHDHAEVLLGLEGAVHGNDERIVSERHDVTFRKNLVHLQKQNYIFCEQVIAYDVIEIRRA